MNIETLIYSLIVAAVTGLSFIAYKHPNGYKKIFTSIMPLAIMALLMVLALNLGKLHSSIRIAGEMLLENPDATIQSASFSITSMNNSLDNILVVVVVGLFVIGYLFFLYKLPSILRSNDNDENT